MASREGAIARATRFFDGDPGAPGSGFKALLAALVAIPSTAQEAGREADLHRYLDGAIRPWVERLGFRATLHPNPLPGFGPILTAERIEDPARPTVLLYGHGDTVRGLDDQWRAGLTPWTLTGEGDRWYGRGTADNKGQHALNLAALEAVLAERGTGKLGCNVKLVLEMAEERGSRGLREFVAAHAKELAADGIPVAVTCRVLKLARQPYYRWLKEAVTTADRVAAARANALFDAHCEDPEFGYRFLADEAEHAG